ncbi:hypothetical protein GS439_06885 [Rhodococcus hoagii]|nr:hypothetical protein [Prescottella equi]
MPAMDVRDFNGWLMMGERGISSNAIVIHLTGIYVGSVHRFDYPHDPSDFRRCELLLRAVPEARRHLQKLASKGLIWEALVENWDELVALGESEVPGIFDGTSSGGGRAPKLYARMRELRETAEVA